MTFALGLPFGSMGERRKSRERNRIMTSRGEGATIAQRARNVLIVLIVGLLTAFGFPSGTVQGQPSERAGVRSPDAPPAAVTAAYWTRERMLAARPYPMPALQGGPRVSGVRTPRTTGPAILVAGGGPGNIARSQIATGAGPELMLSPNPAYSYPFPYSRSGIIPFSLYNAWPWSINGKLFFTQEGINYVCSGTAVTVGSGPPRRALVLTAGHCVNSGGNGSTGGTWNSSTTFCPAYRDGVAPFGCWTWQILWTTGGWWLNSNLRRDVGFVVVANNACGQLGNCVGDDGIAFSASDKQHFWAFGYPAAAPFTGERMILCTASTAIRDAVNALPGPDTMGTGCDMTGGSSGGSWNYGMRMGVTGYANSVNSYKYIIPAQPEAMYGPYFDGAINTLWNDARNSIAP